MTKARELADFLGDNTSLGTINDAYDAGTLGSPSIDDNGNATAITITSDEKIGIGTSTPTRQLDVSKAGTAYIRASDTSSSVNMEMLASSSGGWIGTQTNHSLNFQTNNTERMRIDSEGLKVGTGTGGGNPPANTSVLFGSSDNRNIQFLGQTASGVEGTIGAWNGVYNMQSSKIVFTKPAGNVGDMEFYTNQGTGPVKRMTILHNGDIDIGSFSTTGASAGVQINPAGSGARSSSSATGFSYHYRFYNPNGQCGYIMTNGSATSFVTSSDYRLKENVVDLTGASARVNQLNPSRFNFIADGTDTVVDGFIAHEVATVVPEAIAGTHNEVEVWKDDEELPDGVSAGDNKLDDDGNTIPVYQGIDQSKLVPLLTAALQEALAKIDAMEIRLTTLEG